MLAFLSRIRKDRYLATLKRRGLRVGSNVFLNDGFFLDPSHCYLITIEDDVVFGPGVMIFAHDASSKKVIGKTRVGEVHIAQGAFVGAATVILPGCRIGPDSIIGANSTVVSDIPAGEIWAGSPAKKVSDRRRYEEKLKSTPLPEFISDECEAASITQTEIQKIRAALKSNRFCFFVDRK